MDVLMPQLGETVTEGKITVWFRSVGDQIRAGDNLFEIETDKVSMEVPATAPGMLSEIRVQAGQTARVGATVAVIAGAAAAGVATPAPAHAAAARASARPFEEVVTPPRNFGPARQQPGGIPATPLARRVAAELKVDLAALAARGDLRRITLRDVRAAAAAPAASPSPAPARARADAEIVEIDSMRRTIARRLVESVTTIPQFQLALPIRVAKLVALRAELNADLADRQDSRLSLNDFIVRAWALALMRVPEANAVWAGEQIRRFSQADIGVAVALPGGLVTPVVGSANRKGIGTLSAELRDLVARARARALRPDDLAGGSSAVSNLGMHGIEQFNAIINPPHATILAVGAASRRPIETDQGIGFTEMITATLTCDHRVVDGALGASLLGEFRRLIEHPARILI